MEPTLSENITLEACKDLSSSNGLFCCSHKSSNF